ncbi:MAG: glycosyltransferase N-terminal domain-containing protein, partial [bacterium]
MVFLLYNLMFPFILAAMLPYFLFRMCRRGGYARGFFQRLGWYDAALCARMSGTPRLWVHAVSVGEAYVALKFMDEWRQLRPGVSFVMSVNTSTAHALAEQSLPPGDVLIYFPLDFPLVLSRVFRMLQPSMLILTECELWPNLIRMCRKRGIPVMLINGRMSERSFRRYFRFRGLFSQLLTMVDRFCVQGE